MTKCNKISYNKSMVKDLKEKLNNLPTSSGVYVMLDEMGEIIYIGKARVLKNRVRQYFNSPKNLTDKVIAMVNKINDFYYYVTKTEADALVFESNLIKKHKPQYNILLKDDKNYPYFRINKHQKFPKVEVTRRLRKDKSSYFGPYMGGVPMSELQKLVHEGFKIRTCNLNFDKIPKNHRPCLNYQINRCDAPCIGAINSEDYRLKIEEVIRFLKGETANIEKLLEDKMVVLAENEMFERAIEIRTMLGIVSKINERKLTALAKNIDIDIFTFSTDGINRVVNHLVIRQGRMQGGENINVVDCISTENEVLSTYILQHYQSVEIPDEIITTLPDEDLTALNEALIETRKKRFNILSPKIGFRRGLVEMSEQNGQEYLAKFIDRIKIKADMTTGSAELLGNYLNLPYIKRMECYDISNISGVDKVASMVVFINGEAEKSHYRRFKIKTVEGANDFASMKEVVSRRLDRLVAKDTDDSFGSTPDLIVVDGGKGQLSYALDAMEERGLNIPIIGLAEKNEEIYLPNDSEPLIISKRDNALKMLIRMRDETHRFAITYFRSLHNKNSLKSKLDGIEGVGTKKKAALFIKFETVSKIKKATVKELMEVEGVGKVLATEIFEYFNNTKEVKSNEI